MPLKGWPRRVSVVIMTSMADEALAERAHDQGAAFLKKLFFPADIEAVLCRFYGLRALNPKRAKARKRYCRDNCTENSPLRIRGLRFSA